MQRSEVNYYLQHTREFFRQQDVHLPPWADFDVSQWRAQDRDVAQEILANFQRAPVDLGTSILADRQADRPMEWDIRNGVIQRYGRRHGIAVPVSDVVVPLLAAGSEGPG